MSSPSPSQSPLLNKAPEQLKVTELREELKKRGLTPKGLKKDLVERLEEALRVEDAQRKAVEAIAAPAPVAQIATETVVVESDVTVVQETLIEQAVEEIKGTQASEFLDALPEAGKGGLFPDISGADAEPVAEKERPVEAETEMIRPAEAVIEEDRRLAETTSVNKPAETVIEDGPAETATSVDKPVETVTEEKRGGDSAMSVEVTMEPESAVTTTQESIETTVEEKVVVETVTEVRTSEGEVTRMEETMVVESVEVTQEVRDVKVEVPKEEAMQLQGALEDKKALPDINQEDLSTAFQKQDSQESLAVDAGDKEGQEVPKEEAPKDEIKRQENGEDATMDIDSEAQAGMKRKEHEVPAPDQTKRLRKWNSGKDETKSADNMTPGVNVGLAGSNPVGSRSVVDRISKPVVSTTKSDASNNGRIVPESTKLPTNSLRIDRFVRPFTLKALKDLLAETGSFSDFWIDHIKTHCYVTYSSVEEAVATRNALYNLRWPAVGGKELIADFVEPEEVKQKCESGNDKPAAGAAGAANMTVAVPRAGSERSSLASPNTPVSPFPRPVKEKPQKKESEPIVTLDDLFKKTVAKPNIYYLPLTDAQVAAKRAAKT